MRVIAGKYRSRPLRSLRGMEIRPTSDRLRETLFNVLTAGNPAALEGTVWLDLFAGTGAVGIEALSRGAKEVYFVENAAPAADVIRGNLQSLGISDGFKLLQEELPRAFWRMERQHVAAERRVYRSALQNAGCLHEHAAGAGGFVAGMGHVGGDRRARKEIRSGRRIWRAAAVPETGARQRGAEFLSDGECGGFAGVKAKSL